ncbi:Fe-S cluster assembly protein SufB [Sporobacter termitidis DSM 10068]|uniref:Fe-S cluster assembly protein SufB n=1 Tax=Sporobacter termitidis DSM 10068 TaxID=1123282 RepID=A0A1M5WJ39_9FIRM|nr:Fe-S cluster assembly protein SufB [Sporobacter termitidis]SHH87418.1 Fe-S cluster assembly protein SufB [Sporobacter termitidis DSM 10068]
MKNQKTRVADIDRARFDFRDSDKSGYKTGKGLTADIVAEISAMKNEPAWMLERRLRSLEVYNRTPMPAWGPPLGELDMDEIVTYVRPNTEMKSDWNDVPGYIKNTFERLGIPQAERESLAGVGAQYDSEVVYHNIRRELSSQGVVYTDMETAVREHEDTVKELFMKLVPPEDHKFVALHGAVWSGGSFVYVPEGVRLDIPLQSYFRLNAPGAGQFEHTLIVVEKGANVHFIEGCSAPKYNVLNLHAGCVELYVREGATLRYSTIENWSKNMMNLNTKRALVEKNGTIEWISGTFGSHTTMLYPSSILKGEGARSTFTGITFAGAGQNLDTGAKVVHLAPNTSSTISSRSISKDGGIAVYRSAVSILPEATGAKSSAVCESLMMDSKSRSDTIPVMDIRSDEADIGHEARIGRISDAAVFYLMTRGLSEEEAKAMIVRGFVEPIAKELPLEYAVEMNRLISLELEGTIG